MVLIAIPLLVIVPSSMTCLMPYASQLPSCSMGISQYVFLFYNPMFPMSFLFLFLLTSCSPLPPSICWGSAVPFYLGYFPIEPWDSLSDYVHPGIACVAFQASDWAGAFCTSLSGLLISHLC